MGESIMAEIKSEGQPAFDEEIKGNDNPSDSPTDQTNGDQPQSQGGEENPSGSENKDDPDARFFNHPRWKEREGDWKKRFNDQEVRHTSEINKMREDLETKLAALGKPQEQKGGDIPTEVPPWFGGDEDQWSQYANHTQQLVDKAVEKAVEKTLGTIKQTSEQEEKAIKDATDWFHQSVTDIESDKELNPQSQKVDRNKVLKFAMDNYLVDDKGRWDYKKAFKFMKPTEVFQIKKDLGARKDIAGAVGSDNRPESKPQSFKTSEDFKKPGARPW